MINKPARSAKPKRTSKTVRASGTIQESKPPRPKPDRPARPVGSAIRREGRPAAARAARTGPNAKRVWKAGTMLCPVPVVMVTCMRDGGRANIATVAWTGTVCSEPPMLSISLRKATHSHGIIMATKEFVVNVPSVHQIRATDLCGVISGREEDKFARTGLTAGPATTIKAPIIIECPVNIECAVRRVVELGSHTMFLAEVMAVQVSERLITPTDRLALEQAGLTAFAHGEYFALGKKLGFYGFSVRKRKRARR